MRWVEVWIDTFRYGSCGTVRCGLFCSVTVGCGEAVIIRFGMMRLGSYGEIRLVLVW